VEPEIPYNYCHSTSNNDLPDLALYVYRIPRRADNEAVLLFSAVRDSLRTPDTLVMASRGRGTFGSKLKRETLDGVGGQGGLVGYYLPSHSVISRRPFFLSSLDPKLSSPHNIVRDAVVGFGDLEYRPTRTTRTLCGSETDGSLA
jgi:hypothetical protein